jgi:hypothetical protein
MPRIRSVAKASDMGQGQKVLVTKSVYVVSKKERDACGLPRFDHINKF